MTTLRWGWGRHSLLALALTLALTLDFYLSSNSKTLASSSTLLASVARRGVTNPGSNRRFRVARAPHHVPRVWSTLQEYRRRGWGHRYSRSVWGWTATRASPVDALLQQFMNFTGNLANKTILPSLPLPKKSNIACYDDGNGVLQMVFVADDPLVQGCWDPRNPLDFKLEYCQQQVAVSTGITPSPQRALVLGLGVGAIPRTLREIYPSLRTDVVEIDKEVIDCCRLFFKLGDDGEALSVHHEDATQFVKRDECKETYDLVYMDAYNAQGIPDALLTREFYSDMIACVKPGGILSINLIDDVDDAETVLNYAQEYLDDPLIIRAPSTSNQAIFGRPKCHSTDAHQREGSEKIPRKSAETQLYSKNWEMWQRMKSVATSIDARLLLPYPLSRQVDSIEPLAPVRARNFTWAAREIVS